MFSSILCGLWIIGEDPATALLPSRFLTPFSHRPFRQRSTRVPALFLRPFAGTLRHLRWPASSAPASLRPPETRTIRPPLIVQGGKGGLIPLVKSLKTRLCILKAKPSTVAAAIPGSSPSFLATQNGREPLNITSVRSLLSFLIRLSSSKRLFAPFQNIEYTFPYD